MHFVRHVIRRARHIGASEGRVAALRYLARPRTRWRNWKRYA
jgi:hypothetical protein